MQLFPGKDLAPTQPQVQRAARRGEHHPVPVMLSSGPASTHGLGQDSKSWLWAEHAWGPQQEPSSPRHSPSVCQQCGTLPAPTHTSFHHSQT